MKPPAACYTAGELRRLRLVPVSFCDGAPSRPCGGWPRLIRQATGAQARVTGAREASFPVARRHILAVPYSQTATR
jgi:hypothetical protein